MNDTAPDWRKSSYSAPDGQCVEVATLPGEVRARDSKDPQGPVLTFTRSDWTAFVRDVKCGSNG